MNRSFQTYCAASLFMLAFLFSCEEDFEPATITFYPAFNATGVEPEEDAAGQPLTVVLKTSRVLSEDSKVNIRIEGNGAGYGNSYTTFPPQLEAGVVTLTVPAGENQASFTFTPRNDGVFIPTDYQYTFTIDEIDNKIKSIGQKHFNVMIKDNTEAFFFDNFSACPGTNFTERVASGVSTWGCSGFGFPDEASTNLCREANAFNKGGVTGCNSYLVISTPIDGSQYEYLYISTYVYSRFTGSGGIKFVYSTNYDPLVNINPEADGVTWTPLSEINTALPAAGTQSWKLVAALMENVEDAPIYIAIQHQGGTTASSSSWRIDDFSIKGN
jgi:hypothetical protein